MVMKYFMVVAAAFALTPCAVFAQTGGTTVPASGEIQGQHYSSVTISDDLKTATFHLDNGSNYTNTFVDPKLSEALLALYKPKNVAGD
jgi:hypothetical protein